MRQLGRRNGVRTALGLLAAGTLVAGWSATPSLAGGAGSDASSRTTTPVKHVVVLFGENISFDHYFGTYPHALNPPGQPTFHAAPGTQRVNGLTRELLTRNPNTANPKRLDRSEALTCDQDHGYTAEQEAFDHGLMDKFVQHTQSLDCSPPNVSKPGLVMDYYDGNTVTGLWNYAQHFSMSDNSYGTNFGPSTPGALNLVSGQIYGGVARDAHGNRVLDSYAVVHPNAHKIGTVINDPDPISTTARTRSTTRSRCRAAMSVICSTPPTSVGASSRAASGRPRGRRQARRSVPVPTRTSVA